METLTLAPSISDLATSLKSAFNGSDLSGAERILFSWAESLKAELSQTWSDELLLMGVEKAELEFRVSRLEKELDLVKKENAILQEKVSTLLEIMEGFKKRVVSESINEKLRDLSKIVEGSQRQRGFQEERGKGGDLLVNKTPVKRAFRATFSDSESCSDDNLPIGYVLNVRRVEEESKVVENVGSRKRRLNRAGDEPGPETEARGSGFTSLNEKCLMDDFSGKEDYKGCEMNESDSSGSPAPRKVSTRKRTRKFNYSDTEEEKGEIEEAESGDQVKESKYAGCRHTAKVVP